MTHVFCTWREIRLTFITKSIVASTVLNVLTSNQSRCSRESLSTLTFWICLVCFPSGIIPLFRFVFYNFTKSWKDTFDRERQHIHGKDFSIVKVGKPTEEKIKSCKVTKLTKDFDFSFPLFLTLMLKSFSDLSNLILTLIPPSHN